MANSDRKWDEQGRAALATTETHLPLGPYRRNPTDLELQIRITSLSFAKEWGASDGLLEKARKIEEYLKNG